MSKKIGKREARNKLFEALAHEAENSDVGICEELSDRDLAVINGERHVVAERIRKLISVPKEVAVAVAAEPSEEDLF